MTLSKLWIQQKSSYDYSKQKLCLHVTATFYTLKTKIHTLSTNTQSVSVIPAWMKNDHPLMWSGSKENALVKRRAEEKN